ncbi:MAG: hypothetical protein WBQ37_13635 [Candidatus Competibacter sp.]
MVEPLAGRHHVYGIFALPEACRPGAAVLLSVAGAGRHCDTAEFAGRALDGVSAPIGHYLMRDHIRTRTALWLLLRGVGVELRQPRNWTLRCAVPSVLSGAKQRGGKGRLFVACSPANTLPAPRTATGVGTG